MDSKILGATVASLAMVIASAGAAWSMMTSSPADQSTASEVVTYVTEKSLAPSTALPAHLTTGPAPVAAPMTTTTTAAPAPPVAPQPVYVPPPTAAPQPVVSAPPATAPRVEPQQESDNGEDD